MRVSFAELLLHLHLLFVALLDQHNCNIVNSYACEN
jgi:hypothetical protein